MKKLIFPLLLSVGVIVTLINSTGCKLTPQQATYQTVAVTDVTAVEAVKVYNKLAIAGKTTVEMNKKVEAAFLKYQLAMVALCDMGAVYSASVQTNGVGSFANIQGQVGVVNQTLDDLLTLIRSYGVKL